MKRFGLFGLVTLVGTLFFLGGLLPSATGASYDYYVKEGEDGDGSESDPFGSIADAVDEINEKGGKSIFISKGSYSASLTLPKNVELFGADTKEVTITGPVRMGDKTKISRVTFGSGGNITVPGSADITLDKVRLKTTLGIALTAEKGNGMLIIEDSLIEGGRKGMYIQEGREIRFAGLEVTKVVEEGLDLRANISGSIRKSEFRNNGESGIEVVLGSADLVIESNLFSGNGASGVAAQFYTGTKKVGNVRIENNTFNKNDYGLDCKAPSGGLESKFYYLNSMTVVNNTYSGNRDGEIAKRCKVQTDEERLALEAEEAQKKLQEETYKKSQSISEAELSSRYEVAVTDRKEYDQVLEAAELASVEESLSALNGLLNRLTTEKVALEGRSRALCLLVGPAYADERTFQGLRSALGNLLNRFEREEQVLQYDAGKRLAAERVTAGREIVDSISGDVLLSDCQFSLLGVFARFLSSDEGGEEVLTETEKNLSLLATADTAKLLVLGELAYYPKLRSQIIANGDASPFASVREQLRNFDSVMAHLGAPMTSDLDPIPPAGSAVPLPFPLRFSNVFAAHNIRFLHLGTAGTVTPALREQYLKTEVILGHAAVESLSVPGGEEMEQISVGGIPVVFLEYRETKGRDTAALRERIAEVKRDAKTVIVTVSWDRALSPSIGEERKTVARELIAAGADLIIGTGLGIGASSEVFDGRRAYYSLGAYWGDFQTPSSDEGRKSVALVVTIPVTGPPTVEEKAVSFSQTGAFTFSE